MNLPNKKYSLIYADPAWEFRDKNTGGKHNSGAGNKYKVMSLSEMAALPITDICKPDCFLAMWWVGSQPDNATALARAWGFEVKTATGFTWQKLTKSGTDHFGMGHWTRQSVENCLFAVRGKPARASASVRNFIASPRMEHSRKPPEARTRLIKLLGDVPRIELFSRQKVKGWDCWGNEIRPDGRHFAEIKTQLLKTIYK